MSQAFTTDVLLSRVKFLSFRPQGGGGITDANILECAYEQLVTEVAPFVVGLRQRYYTREYTFSTVSGQFEYDLPPDLSADAVHYVRSSLTGIEGYLTQIFASDRWQLSPTILRAAGVPSYFYIDGNKLCVLPTPGSNSVTLTLSYDVRQPKLVALSAASLVTASSSPTQLAVSGVPPTTFTTYAADSATQPQLWVVRPNQPRAVFGATTAAYCNIASTTTNLVRFTTGPTGTTAFTGSNIPASVGDYVCLYQESVVPFLPAEAQPVLWQATAAAILRTFGTSEAYAACAAELERKKDAMSRLLSNRSDEAPKKTARYSPLAGGQGRRWARGRW